VTDEIEVVVKQRLTEINGVNYEKLESGAKMKLANREYEIILPTTHIKFSMHFFTSPGI
jgi:hypothetical protein